MCPQSEKYCEIGVLEMLDLQEIETYPLTNECPPRVSPIASELAAWPLIGLTPLALCPQGRAVLNLSGRASCCSLRVLKRTPAAPK